MIVTERHPLDGVLADLGSLVRRVRVGALDEEVYLFAAGRIRAELAEIDPHLAGRVSAALDQLEQVEESGRMTLGLFEVAAREIRDAITARRVTQPQPNKGA
ncbi:hypothetical protein ACFPIF_09890 [Brevundimonas faecalis]|uniref:hypothetical protein n=1 Tax=Brevundimonas faecalis TaxID=947378 RepID=UPI00360C72CF